MSLLKRIERSQPAGEGEPALPSVPQAPGPPRSGIPTTPPGAPGVSGRFSGAVPARESFREDPGGFQPGKGTRRKAVIQGGEEDSPTRALEPPEPADGSHGSHDTSFACSFLEAMNVIYTLLYFECFKKIYN